MRIDKTKSTSEITDVHEAPEITDAPATEEITDVPAEVPLNTSTVVSESASPVPNDKPQTPSEDKPGTIHPEEEIQPEDLQPNSTYERNGYEYTTDENGHPMRVFGTLRLDQGERTQLQTEVGHQGIEGDEGGHLIGTRFNGPTDAFNLVPQNANLNRGEWKAMENSWAEALAEGADVKVLIEPIYEGDSNRPKSFDVLTQINGDLMMSNFENQASVDPTEGGENE